MKKRIISPSILSANFLNLEKDIKLINKSVADLIHVDIMDGLFVPNISFGTFILKILNKYLLKPIDVHLMTINPEKYINEIIHDKYKRKNIKYLHIHYESCSSNLINLIYTIKNSGINAGIVLNPHTPLNIIEEIIDYIDFILLMSVNPGFSGQKIINNIYSKLKKARKIIDKKNKKILIGVDGGVNLSNCYKLFSLGADVLISGNAIFLSSNPIKTIFKMKNL
ncbi:ribulose-phosphate 3-epimerase [Candidatus Shikimatogenerans silvanidophilus]|uniref:ribulose-phosphate 3-epimerase n=1 Tax=Candidatus Shikimatogenerans silvanidophilus TaxID=2782547 RepID=UPI001BAE174E|nr:ribulose-phosphate 3-epimerase [Candidatus Shikimatogenerans silvanidophilus]